MPKQKNRNHKEAMVKQKSKSGSRAKSKAKPKTKLSKAKPRSESKAQFAYVVFTIFLFAIPFALGYLSNSLLAHLMPQKASVSSTDAMATKHFASEVVFGKTAEGKDMKGYEIGEGKKVIFLLGSIHGNEMGGASLLERFTIELKQNPTKLSKEFKLVILPVANPDGFYDRIDKLNANGVNLNLNFQTTGWQQYGPTEHQFAGDHPFSEPESNVIRKIIEDYKPFEVISFHSEGGQSVPESNDSSINLAKWYANESGYDYDNYSYDYFGTVTRWFAEKTGQAAITVELSDHFSNDWEKNKKPLLELAAGKI